MKQPAKRRGYDEGGTVSSVSDTPPKTWQPGDRGPAVSRFGTMAGTSGPLTHREQTWQQYKKDAASSEGKRKGGKVTRVLKGKTKR